MKIKITKCTAFGDIFKILTPDSIHEVIETPEWRKDKTEIWVMGNGKPVRLLKEEFNIIEE